jgi:hypothetical protein
VLEDAEEGIVVVGIAAEVVANDWELVGRLGGRWTMARHACDANLRSKAPSTVPPRSNRARKSAIPSTTAPLEPATLLAALSPSRDTGEGAPESAGWASLSNTGARFERWERAWARAVWPAAGCRPLDSAASGRVPDGTEDIPDALKAPRRPRSLTVLARRAIPAAATGLSMIMVKITIQ